MNSITYQIRQWGLGMLVSLLAILTLFPAIAQAGDITFTDDTPIVLDGNGIQLQVNSGSDADTFIVDSTFITVTVAGGETLTLEAPNANELNNNGGLPSCLVAGGVVTMNIGGPATVTVTPSTTSFCSTSTGSSTPYQGPTTMTSTTPDIEISTPTSATSLTAGTSTSVSWELGGAGISTVQLRYSTDGGLTSTLIADNLDKNQPYLWNIPSHLSGSVRLIAVGHDSGKAALDTDNMNLTINPAPDEGTPSGTSVYELDEERGITTDNEGRRIAPESGSTGPSPITGEPETVSVVYPGQYVRSYGFNTLYYITDDLERRPFWDATTFMTWADSFDEAVWVTDATLTTMALGAPMLPKPGVVLVKIQSDPKTYYVDTDPNTGAYRLRWVPSEEVASALFGSNWADFVIDLQPTTFARYVSGPDMTSSDSVDTSIMRTRLQLADLVAGQ